MPVTAINDDAHFALELQTPLLVVVDFFATWCGPCRRIAPFVEELSGKYRATCKFVKVDVDQCQDTAAAYGVTAMPTFMFFRNGAKVAEFSGANPQQLEETIKRLAQQSSAPSGPVIGHSDLKEEINMSQVECLNESHAHTKSAVFVDDGSYLESDCDEQLLLTIPFNSNVKIHSIRIRGPPDGSAPKDVKLFVNRPSLGFAEAESENGVQELSLSPAEASGALINLKFVRFQNVSSLTIFVHSNQGDEDTSKIQYIEIVGSSVVTTNMQQFKRVAGKEGESDH